MATYHVVHNNHYSFAQPVKHCSLEARLAPLENSRQRVDFSQFVLRPLAASQRTEKDNFGNQVSYFEIYRNLRSFQLSAIHTVTTSPHEAIQLDASPPWEQVVAKTALDAGLQAKYPGDSPAYTQFDRDLHSYACVSFTAGRPLLAATFDLMRRINEDFEYDAGATSVDTSAREAFRLKRGVCQDFSHIGIACLRSLDLPVRYVSGYVDTSRAGKTKPRLGADVSHAWFSVYGPGHGWVDFDPTNNTMPGETYIRVAQGRDYDDVAPLRGEVDSKGRNRLKVSVSMTVV